MIRTITVGSTVFIQGTFVKNLSDGQIAVKVFGSTFIGHPVASYKAPELASE